MWYNRFVMDCYVAAISDRQSIRVQTRIEQTIFCFYTIVKCAYIYVYALFGCASKPIGSLATAAGDGKREQSAV